MRILFLADRVFEDLPGGSRVVARELARGLVRRGHEVTFLVARQGPEAQDPEAQDPEAQDPEAQDPEAQDPEAPTEETRSGFRIVRYSGAGSVMDFARRGRAACAALLAERLSDAGRPFDVVHTHFAYAAVGPLKAVPEAVPRVRTFHGPWDEEGWVEDVAGSPGLIGRGRALIKKGLRRRVEVSSLRRSDRVVTLSDCFRRRVIEGYGVPGGRVQTIPGGTDVARFVPSADKGAVRAALGLPEGRRILLSVRRLAPRMGLDNLIKAMPAVVARHPDTLLLLGGEGPERGRLEALIRDLRLAGHVRMTGFIPDDQLAAYYQSADLFVLPTLALEGFGLVTTEALACGVPVIGTDIGATPEILSRLDPRLVVSGTSPGALGEAILGFFEQGWARALTPEHLRRFILDHYQWDQHIAAMERLYQELAEASGWA